MSTAAAFFLGVCVGAIVCVFVLALCHAASDK